MSDKDEQETRADSPEAAQFAAAGPGDFQLQPIWPFLPAASGLYQWSFPVFQPIPQAVPAPDPSSGATKVSGPEAAAPVRGPARPISPIWWWFRREELRLDVDGRYPQSTASGVIQSGLTGRVHWIAELTASGFNTWTGPIWYKDGNTASLPHTNVTITVVRSWFANQRQATVTFTGGGAANRVRTHKWLSPYFHDVEFEFDTVAGTTAVTSIDSCDHPNRPSSLPCETLTIEKVYQRAGFDVSKSGGDGGVPISGAGANALWSDMEMHDAMQTYWSRFANKAQWSMWVLFAHLHEATPWIPQPEDLGGIMFDDIGPNHRQGTAIFNGSFIKNPPPGDPDPAAWVKRTKFWTACHEIGHAFNLAHSWDKAHPPSWGTPWIPIPDEPEARSFMNYPNNVSGGQQAFYGNFEYRFSDQELLFMRHAPARFVQMGNADWFDNHAFQQAAVSPQPDFELTARVHRQTGAFEFLEPVSIELKLKNVGAEPQVVNEKVLVDTAHMTLIIKKQGKAARQWSPYATRCFRSAKTVIQPGGSIYTSLEVSSGLNGWDLAEPGVYQVQVCLHLGEEDVVSNPLRLRVAPPRSYDEEYLAQDFFSEDVGRILSFGGSRFLESGNDCLHEVVERLGDRRVAYHAREALASPLTRKYKTLALASGTVAMNSVAGDEGVIKESAAKPSEARKQLSACLTAKAGEAVETFGHIGYHRRMARYSRFLADNGDSAGAAKCHENLRRTLASRGVLKSVLDEIKLAVSEYAEMGGGKRATRKAKSKVKQPS